MVPMTWEWFKPPHVGVGIIGREGVQAACASDYTIGQFRFLTKLLFVHGVWNYRRLCKVLLYSFYKNICLYVMEVSRPRRESELITSLSLSSCSFGLLFTMDFRDKFFSNAGRSPFTTFSSRPAPPMALGLLDRCCSAETMMRFPAMYKMSQNRSDFNIKVNHRPPSVQPNRCSLRRSFGLGVWTRCTIRSFSTSCPMQCYDTVRRTFVTQRELFLMCREGEESDRTVKWFRCCSFERNCFWQSSLYRQLRLHCK